MSLDSVAAALLGGLIETLGYTIRFFRPPESPDEALRRERPKVAMIDCRDPLVMNGETLGHARMRGSSVVIFGPPNALRGVERVAREHDLEAIIMPASVSALDEALRKAVADYC